MNRYHEQGEQMWRNPQNRSWAKPSRVSPRGCRNGIPASHRVPPTTSDEHAWKGIQTGLCSCWCESSPHLCLIPLPVFVHWWLIPGSREEHLTCNSFNPNSGLTDPSPPVQRRFLLMFSYVWKHVCDNFFGNFSFWNTQVTPGLSQGVGEPWRPQGVVIWWDSLSWGHYRGQGHTGCSNTKSCCNV